MSTHRGSAVVVGGGVGGVAAALALVRIGLDVVVLERSEQQVDQGSGITLFGNGLAALDAIGAGAAVRAAGAPPPPGSSGLRRPDGRVVVDAAIARAETLREGLTAYASERRLRTTAIVRAARRTGRVAQADGRLAVGLRTLALRLTRRSSRSSW